MPEVVHDASLYFAASEDRVFRGRRFACARSQAGVFGLVAWGRLMKPDTEELVKVLDAALYAQHNRRQIVDLREVGYVAPAAMHTLIQYFVETPAYLRTVCQEAVVRPDGVVGILAEGMYRVVPMPFPGRVFCHLDEAFEWLGDSEGWSAQTASLLKRHSDQDPLMARLRQAVLRHGVGLTVAGAARAVAMSARTLQRHLRRLETTWPRLRRALAIEEAQILLAAEHDVRSLGLRLGFRSASRFGEAFRLVTGSSPSSWLNAHRTRHG